MKGRPPLFTFSLHNTLKLTRHGVVTAQLRKAMMLQRYQSYLVPWILTHTIAGKRREQREKYKRFWLEGFVFIVQSCFLVWGEVPLCVSDKIFLTLGIEGRGGAGEINCLCAPRMTLYTDTNMYASREGDCNVPGRCPISVGCI